MEEQQGEVKGDKNEEEAEDISTIFTNSIDHSRDCWRGQVLIIHV